MLPFINVSGIVHSLKWSIELGGPFGTLKMEASANEKEENFNQGPSNHRRPSPSLAIIDPGTSKLPNLPASLADFSIARQYLFKLPFVSFESLPGLSGSRSSRCWQGRPFAVHPEGLWHDRLFAERSRCVEL